jgi:hypothetical protein
MLKFNGPWRFNSPGRIPREVIYEFSRLIGVIATQGKRWDVLERFKTHFAGAAGTTCVPSTTESWAETDLDNYMSQAGVNAALFIEAFYDGCQSLRSSHDVPDVSITNRVLSEHRVGFIIQPPNLIAQDAEEVINVPDEPASLDQQAREIIQESLSRSEKLLSEGHDRAAVQELLWLLETISTAFQGLDTGMGTIQGKYFNKIAEDLRRKHRGKTLDQVLDWITTLHGYLSSPTGGGIRHGTDLKAGIATQPNEARLFCNLIRSYIGYLIAEHERLSSR